MIHEIILPKQGLQMTEGFITRWICKEGDTVTQGEPLFEMETDKLVITIDASCSGRLLKIVYPEGSTVPITTVIAYVGDSESDSADDITTAGISGISDKASANDASVALTENAAAGVPDAVSGVQSVPEQSLPEQSMHEQSMPEQHGAQREVEHYEQKNTRIFVTPRARGAAATRNISLADIIPTGPDGLIIERDVLNFRKPDNMKTTDSLPAPRGVLDISAAARRYMPQYTFTGHVRVFKGGADDSAAELAEKVLRLAFEKAADITGVTERAFSDETALNVYVKIIESAFVSSAVIPYTGANAGNVNHNTDQSDCERSTDCERGMAAGITLCGDNVTLALPCCLADADSAVKLFELLCMFAENPWLAAVK